MLPLAIHVVTLSLFISVVTYLIATLFLHVPLSCLLLHVTWDMLHVTWDISTVAATLSCDLHHRDKPSVATSVRLLFLDCGYAEILAQL